MGDIIYCGAIMGVLVVFSVWYAIIGGASEHRVFSAGDYGIKVKAVRCWKFFF